MSRRRSLLQQRHAQMERDDRIFEVMVLLICLGVLALPFVLAFS